MIRLLVLRKDQMVYLCDYCVMSSMSDRETHHLYGFTIWDIGSPPTVLCHSYGPRHTSQCLYNCTFNEEGPYEYFCVYSKEEE